MGNAVYGFDLERHAAPAVSNRGQMELQFLLISQHQAFCGHLFMHSCCVGWFWLPELWISLFEVN